MIIEKSRPNGFYLALQQDGEGEDARYFVCECDDEDGVEFDGDLEGARAYYNERKEILGKTPNHDAQAAYDEANGTHNGYAPWDVPLEY